MFILTSKPPSVGDWNFVSKHKSKLLYIKVKHFACKVVLLGPLLKKTHSLQESLHTFSDTYEVKTTNCSILKLSQWTDAFSDLSQIKIPHCMSKFVLVLLLLKINQHTVVGQHWVSALVLLAIFMNSKHLTVVDGNFNSQFVLLVLILNYKLLTTLGFTFF